MLLPNDGVLLEDHCCHVNAVIGRNLPMLRVAIGFHCIWNRHPYSIAPLEGTSSRLRNESEVVGSSKYVSIGCLSKIENSVIQTCINSMVEAIKKGTEASINTASSQYRSNLPISGSKFKG